ncbi:UNVERIFIED_CONTAM: hypothetical protein RMT77_016961 [Armadillidium vulgare]
MNDLIEAQSTTIHHITDMAKYEPTLVRDYLKIFNCSWIPKRIFTPFNLALALSLVHIGRYKTKIIDSIKSCILKHYKFEEKQQKSLWLSEAFKESFDLLKVFKTTVDNCKGGWDQVSEGMVLVCFSLLESGTSFTYETYTFKKVSFLATSILPSVLKKEPRLAVDILKTTSCLILSSSSPQQYIDLLGRLVKSSPVILLDQVNQIRELLEQTMYLPFNVGSQLLRVLLPLIKINFTLKDSLILILRKMLFSREVESRRVAVQGFINILAHFRVMGALPSSQASFSFSSTLSQISVDVHSSVDSNTNEALCLELLGVLRRCFTQQFQVRRTMYEGLSDVAKSNVKLVHNIMELLYQHLSTFIDIKEEILNPVKLHKTVTSQGESIIILEPLGELLLCLSKCKSFHDNRKTSRGMDDDEDDDFVATLNGICSMFDSLVEKLAYCDLDDLNIGNISCSSAGARGKTNIMYVEVMIGVYDGLLHWVFCNDALQSPDKMKDLIALFKTQRKIIEATKEKPKPTKKGEQSHGASKSNEKVVSQKQVTYKSVLSIDVAVQLLQAYIISDDDVNSRCAEILSSSHEFHIYILDVLDQNIASLKTMLPSQQEKIFPHLKAAGVTLLRESINAVGNDENDDDERERSKIRHYLSTMHSLMIAYVKYYKDKLPQIFKELTAKSASKDYSSLLFYVAKACHKSLQRVLRKEDNSAYARESTLLIQIISLITPQMEINSKGLIEIQDLINQTCKDHAIDNNTVCESLVQLLLSTTDGIKASSNLVRSFARELHFRLGDVEQDVALEECNDYKIVSEFSSQAILATLCSYIDEILALLKLVLFKLKQYLTAGEKYDREDIDRMISLKFAVIVHALHEIFQSAVPHGTSQDVVLSVTSKFYLSICMYVKYYIERYRIDKNTAMSDKFEKLVQLCANMLKDNASKMISYIHSTTPQHPLGKLKQNVLAKRAIKECKLIPKLVYAIEEYEKFLFKLTKSSKVNLLSGTRITTSRDFRILADNLQEGMKNFEEDDESKSGEEDRDEEEEDEDQENEDPTEDVDQERPKSPVPKKRRKK